MKSKYILLAMSLLMFIQFSVTAQVTAMDPKDLLATAQMCDDAINTHKADLVLPITTDDMVWDYVPLSTPFVGNKAFEGAINSFFKSFPDMRVENIRPPLVSGNIVVVEHWATGTQLGEIVSPLGIIPPTGKTAKAMHMDILEFEGNKIKKSTTYDDMASQFMQLGILPAMALPKFKPSFTLPAPEPTKLSPMEAETKAESLWNAHDLQGYAKLFKADADFMVNTIGIPMNREAFIASQEMYIAGFPDIKMDVVRNVDMGDGWILSEQIYKGTNTGSYLGFPATGRPIMVRGALVVHVNSDGLQTNFYSYWDQLTLLAQLGMLQPPADTEANKELVKNTYYGECWNKANFDAVKEKFASDYVFRGPSIGEFKGFTAFTQLVTAYRKAFPDMLWTLEDQIAEGDLVVSRMTGTGTNNGDFMGVPATGKKMMATSISIIRIVDGKIKESWTFADMMGVMQQLGLMPPSREKYDWGAPSNVVGKFGDLEANKAVVMRYIEEFWNQKKLNVLDEIANPNIVSHAPIESINPIIGIETNKKATQTYISAFPDLNVTVDDFFAEGDKVIERWTAKAIHQGAIMGIPPTGKAVVWTGFTIYRLADGKIVEIWWAWDALGLMKQLTAAVKEIANKAIVQRYFDDVWNKGKSELIPEFASADILDHLPEGESKGIEGLKQHVVTTLTTFPDIHIIINDMVAKGNEVAMSWTANGTHKGVLLGAIPPTNKQVIFTGITIFNIVDNKFTEIWSTADMLGLMQQLGVMPANRTSYDWGTSSKVTGAPGNPESNMSIARRDIEEVWNQGRLDVADEIAHKDFVAHTQADPRSPLFGTEKAKEAIASYIAAFPDLHITIEDIFAEGDKAVIRWSTVGTQKGELMGIPPTGRKVSYSGIIMYRFADGKIADDWWAWDALGMMQQLTASTEKVNKAIQKRVFDEIWNKGMLNVADEIYASDAVLHGFTATDIKGTEGFKQFVAVYRASFPDIQWTVNDQIAEGDRVLTRLTGTGTHQFKFMDIPATGKKVTATAMSIVRIVDGKIVEAWTNYDTIGLMQQLGVIPNLGREVFAWSESTNAVSTGTAGSKNIDAVKLAVDEVWNKHNLGAMDVYMSDKYDHHDPFNQAIRDFNGFKLYVTMMLSAFPDLHLTIDDAFTESDKVAYRWTFTGTHNGELKGIKPTGNKINFKGMTINRAVDGKIVEGWWAIDVMGLYQQLGVIPTAKPETPEGYDNVFFASLSPGLNMISLPLKPITPYTAKSFATEIGATVVIKYNEVSSKFEGFSMNTPGNGFTIEGGKGYIVNVPKGGTVAFTGAAWTNEPPVEAAPPAKNNDAWAFMVNGLLLDGESMNVADGIYTLTVKNMQTRAIATETVDSNSGYFNTVWADMNRKAVVKSGDKLEITVTDSSGKVVSGPFVREISLDEIRNALIDVKMKLGDIIPDKSLLLQNYPNPFNPETWLPFYLKNASDVVIKIYSSNGQLVKTLDLGHRDAGIYVTNSKAAYWDGKDEFGEKTASGIYFYNIQAGNFSAVKKLIVLK